MEEIRQRLVAEARTWLGTPWHHNARVKGAGVDCAQLLIAVYAALGLMPDIDLGWYPADWHLHQDHPRFLEVLAQYAAPLEGAPLEADVAMFKYGRHAAHGSIVLAWPLVLHASRTEGARVTITDALASQDLAPRFAGFWRLKGL